MTAKHTPGPWQCYVDLPSADPNWHIVTNESRMRVLANVHIEPGNVVDEANARLIAAAPDLLAALRRLLASTPQIGIETHTDGCGCVLHEAIGALAKAESR